jgi:hypothetical protein
MYGPGNQVFMNLPEYWKFAALLLLMALATTLHAQPAELIFVGHNVITMDEANTGADSVAIGQGKILAVGDRETAPALNAGDRKVQFSTV